MVSLGIIAVFLLLGKYDWRVLTGCLVGSALTVLNFAILCISVNRAIDNIMAERGNAEMDDEQASEFAQKHKGTLTRTIQLSGAIRTLSIVVVLILAFALGDYFDVIATLIPLISFRPILMLTELIPKKQR